MTRGEMGFWMVVAFLQGVTVGSIMCSIISAYYSTGLSK